MNKFSALRTAVAAAAVLMLPLAQAATMSRTDYSASKSRISETYKADKAACAPLKSNAKDICIEEAKAKEKVARAELEYGYTGKAKDGTKVWTAKADAAFAVAKEKCDDLSGNAKDVCRQEAKTTHTKALADAKMGKQVAEARTDAAQTKRDADYKLAAEKCDSMSGDAKSQCMDNAKRTFGKM
jgi:hypothetical protein